MYRRRRNLIFSFFFQKAESFWSIAMQIVATLIAVVMLLRHWDVFFAAGITWGLIGIGVGQKKVKTDHIRIQRSRERDR
jgi:hypothetical protein